MQRCKQRQNYLLGEVDPVKDVLSILHSALGLGTHEAGNRRARRIADVGD